MRPSRLTIGFWIAIGLVGCDSDDLNDCSVLQRTEARLGADASAAESSWRSSIVALASGKGVAPEDLCTGVLIESGRVLTSSACATQPTRVWSGPSFLQSEDSAQVDTYYPGPSNALSTLQFSGRLRAQLQPLAVSGRALVVGDRVTLAGFDRSEQREFGALRVATGTVTKVDAYVTVERDGGSDTCIGDRGGALLVNALIDGGMIDVDASVPEMNVEVAGVRVEPDGTARAPFAISASTKPQTRRPWMFRLEVAARNATWCSAARESPAARDTCACVSRARFASVTRRAARTKTAPWDRPRSAAVCSLHSASKRSTDRLTRLARAVDRDEVRRHATDQQRQAPALVRICFGLPSRSERR